MKLRIRVNDDGGLLHTLRLDIPGQPDVAALQQHLHQSLSQRRPALAGFTPALPPGQLSFSLNKKTFFRAPPDAPVASFGVCSGDLLHARLEPADQTATPTEPSADNVTGLGSAAAVSSSASGNPQAAAVVGSPPPEHATRQASLADGGPSPLEKLEGPRPADAPEPMDFQVRNSPEAARMSPVVPTLGGTEEHGAGRTAEEPSGPGNPSLGLASEPSARPCPASQIETRSSGEAVGAELNVGCRGMQARAGSSDAAACVMQAVQSALQEVGFVQAPDSAAPDAQSSVRTFRLPRSCNLPEGTHGEAMACQVRVVPMGTVAVLVYAWCASTAGCSGLQQEQRFVQPGVLRVEILVDAVSTGSFQAAAAPSQIQARAATPTGSSAQDATAVSVHRRMAEARALWVKLTDQLALPVLHHCYDCAGLGAPAVPSMRALPQEVLKAALFPRMDSGSLAALCCASRDFRDAVEGAEGVWERLYLTEIPDTDRVGWETPKQGAVGEEPSEQASDEGMDGVVGSGRGGAGRKGLWKACFAAAWRRKREREAREEEARVQWPRFMGRRRRPFRPLGSPDPFFAGFPRFMGDRRFIHGGDYDRLPGGAMGPYIGGGFNLGGGGVF